MGDNVYTLRHLNASDVFPMMRIIKKIGVKEFKACFDTDDIKALVNEAKDNGTEADTTAIGVNVALDAAQLLMERLPECEAEIYKFLSGLSGMAESEIAQLPFGVFGNMLIDVFKDQEFNDFFTAVSRLFS